MILNNAPQNEAIVSNVGEIGEFRIRNSAKAFSILSSGLYANKIRAVIRELSCNAVDSHAAAGNTGTPFDVHLPNSLEPHFSIRDYGTGLSHEQVTNIYTTYFESTKTNSNAFIGALGLGSKSPFSYTDNFTVTAIQNGRKGIYTAFINEAGVPSIAQMMEEATDEPNGVEVKFAVTERYDFDKFRQEARNVYRHFALRPVVSGNDAFGFDTLEYETRDIIPGVHSYKNGHRSGSVAIMGNIAYPIDIPAADQSIDQDVRSLLSCGLEMHFNIGELDFQASREGLSYIPSTIQAIKHKLESLNAALTGVLSTEADAIENLWDRAVFLYKKKENRLWTAAVSKYVADTALPTYSTTRYHSLASFGFRVEDLAANYNIVIKRLSQVRHNSTISNGKSRTEYSQTKDANGNYTSWQEWQIAVDDTCHFVINDLKTGASERARYHYKETGCTVHNRTIWILEKADKSKDMDTSAFFAAIQEPPLDRRFAASTLKQRERNPAGITKDATILRLEQRKSSGYSWGYRQRDKDMVWRDAGSISTFDKKTKFYYVPLNGFSMQSSKGYTSGKELYEDVSSYPGLKPAHIYGVRKSDIEEVKKRKNWINFEDYVTKELASRNHDKLLLSLVRSSLQDTDILNHHNLEILRMIDAKSPYAVTVNKFKDVAAFDGNSAHIKRLFQRFCPSTSVNPDTLMTKHQAELDVINKRYPLIPALSSYRTNPADIAEYISLIDEKKGI